MQTFIFTALSVRDTRPPVSVVPAPSSLLFMCLFLVQSHRLEKRPKLHATLRKDQTPCFAVDVWGGCDVHM